MSSVKLSSQNSEPIVGAGSSAGVVVVLIERNFKMIWGCLKRVGFCDEKGSQPMHFNGKNPKFLLMSDHPRSYHKLSHEQIILIQRVQQCASFWSSKQNQCFKLLFKATILPSM
jgi:hypothetical protein